MSRPSPSIKVSRPSPSTTKLSRPSTSIQPVQHVGQSPNDEFQKYIDSLKVHITQKMNPDDSIYLPPDYIVGPEQLVMINMEDLKAIVEMEWATATDIRVYQRYVLNYLYTIVVYIRVYIRVYI